MKSFPTGQILVIDDDPGVISLMNQIIKGLGHEVDSALNLTDGLGRIFKRDFDVVFLDVNLPDGDGIQAIEQIKSRPNSPQVIIMTAFSDPDGAQLAIESGAWDYMSKPSSPKVIRLQITRALQYQKQKKQAADRLTFSAPDIVGASQALNRCFKQATQILNSDANVLITGETGTGKELFARAIHENSPRRQKEFIVVDCSILSKNLIESVLFGHEKGAFTGAERNRKGLVALADGGTLFLDEVGELPETIQASFLRVLQEKKFRPVGSEKEVKSDFRLICATNQDLEKMAEKKNFRSDLLFRLKTFVLDLPPLRHRAGDIQILAECQIKKSCREHGIPQKNISPDFMEMIEKYRWPGNVRELINTIETSVSSAHNEETLFAFHLPSGLRAEIARSNVQKPSHPVFGRVQQAADISSFNHQQFMEQAEKLYLESLHRMCEGDVKLIIEKTGLSRSVLYRKLKQFQIK